MDQPPKIDQTEPPDDDQSIELRQQPLRVRGLRRLIYIALAAVCLSLGLVGVVLPGLPTTPFLLLMSFFLLRSWPWLHDQVLRIPFVGRPIRDWDTMHGIRPHIKVAASLMVVVVVSGTLLSQSAGWPLKVATVVLASCGMLVVWRLPSV